MSKNKEIALETLKNPFPDRVPDGIWQDLCRTSPSDAAFFASAPWQDTQLAFSSDDVFTEPTYPTSSANPNAKRNNLVWREQQKEVWKQYRGFGPINAAVNGKADCVAGAGFDIYSDNLEIDSFLRELWYGFHNKCFERAPGWMVRMQAESELFLLLAIDETGKIKIRVLEPSRIGMGFETGLVCNPDDATETLFYRYHTTNGL